MNIAAPPPELPVGGSTSGSNQSTSAKLSYDAPEATERDPSPEDFEHQFKRELSEQPERPQTLQKPSPTEPHLVETGILTNQSPLPLINQVPVDIKETDIESAQQLADDQTFPDAKPQKLLQQQSNTIPTDSQDKAQRMSANQDQSTRLPVTTSTPPPHSSEPAVQTDEFQSEAKSDSPAKPAAPPRGDRQELLATRSAAAQAAEPHTQQNLSKPPKNTDLGTKPETQQRSGIQTARTDPQPLTVESEQELETELNMRAKTQSVQERHPVTTAPNESAHSLELNRLNSRPQNASRPLEATFAPTNQLPDSSSGIGNPTAALEGSTMTREIEQIQNIIKDHALLIKRFNQDSMTAEIRPDGKTPITLSLQSNGDSVIVSAVLDARNAEWMRQNWQALQARLAEQNIILEEPQARTENDSESFDPREQQSQSNPESNTRNHTFPLTTDSASTQAKAADATQSENESISTEKVYWA